MRCLILFSFHPFANIGRAVLKLNAIRLATRYRLFFNTATEREYRESPTRRSLNPERHRSGRSSKPQVDLRPIAVLHRGIGLRQCNRAAIGIWLKTGILGEIRVTEFREMPEFREWNEVITERCVS